MVELTGTEGGEREPIGRKWSDYPVGTKAHALSGGYWTKIAEGRWQWAGGSTFPTPGGDAVSVTLPAGEESGAVTEDAQRPGETDEQWYSYNDLREAIEQHLGPWIIEDDVAEVAILLDAIQRVGDYAKGFLAPAPRPPRPPKPDKVEIGHCASCDVSDLPTRRLPVCSDCSHTSGYGKIRAATPAPEEP